MHMSTDITCPFNKVLCTPMPFQETNNVYLALEYPIGAFFFSPTSRRNNYENILVKGGCIF